MTFLWTSALQRLSSKVAPLTYEMCLRPIEARSEGERLVLRFPNQAVRLWFESTFFGELKQIVDDFRKDSGQEVRLETEVADVAARRIPDGAPVLPLALGSSDPVPVPLALESGGAIASVASGFASGPIPALQSMQPLRVVSAEPISATGLNPNYTFDTFVAGPSNQLAHAAARAVSSPEPPRYNPLFLCGGVGLGKTHLMHAMGNEILRSRPGARIRYLSGERFMNEYIQSIRDEKTEDFRRRYREGCDVLLLDDIQFIAGKDSTQQEFFHTFNALYEQSRQIVLSADRKPHEIPDIADRLRTRFAWGLMADIEPPELEVRVAILKKKADARGISIPDDVALYIAQAVKSNVRELEGALARLAACAWLHRRDITLEFTRETLEGSIAQPSEHLTVDAVLKAVASYYQVKVSDLKSERRHKSIAGPRAVAMFLARKHTKESYPDLGRAFGNKHHTTVLSAVEKIDLKVKTDHALRGEINSIESQLLR